MEQPVHIRTRVIAQGLMGYLLLLYVLWLPLHLQSHSHRTLFPESQQDDGTRPIEHPCSVCDWWTHQPSAENPVSFQCARTELPYIYYSPCYVLPPRVATRLANSRAPPSFLFSS